MQNIICNLIQASQATLYWETWSNIDLLKAPRISPGLVFEVCSCETGFTFLPRSSPQSKLIINFDSHLKLILKKPEIESISLIFLQYFFKFYRISLNRDVFKCKKRSSKRQTLTSFLGIGPWPLGLVLQRGLLALRVESDAALERSLLRDSAERGQWRRVLLEQLERISRTYLRN